MTSPGQPCAPDAPPNALAAAVLRCTEALRTDPTNPMLKLQRGMAYYRLGDHAAAIVDYGQALRQRADFAEAYNNRGAAYYAHGDLAAARADFDQALHLRPDYAEAHNNRGALRQAHGDLPAALADFDEAIRLRPGYSEAYHNRGTVRRALRDCAGAVEDFTRVLQFRPDDAAACEERAETYHLLWNHQAAAADYDRVLALLDERLAPRRCRAHVYRGDARYHNGDPAGLLTDYREAFRINGALAAGFVIVRMAADLECDRAAVFADCAAHLRLRPDDGVTHARRGLINLLDGKEADAHQAFAGFLSRFPADANPLHQLIARAREHRERADAVHAGLPSASRDRS